MSKIAFLFPGQGAQSVGMGKDLYESLPAAKELFDSANDILGYDLAKLCFTGPAEDLDSTVYSQPALFVTSLAYLEALKDKSPDTVLACEAAAGLSLGEYTAMVFAGVMSFEEGLRLVQKRGQAMQDAADATPSGMVSVLMLEPVQVEQVCQQARQGDEILEVANLLCPGNTVISGVNSACERAIEIASEMDGRTVPLAVAGAFHTQVMHPADERLAEALADVKMNRPQIPVVSNVDALPHDNTDEIRELLIKQVLHQVRWEDSMRYLIDLGCTEFYEVGPGRVLRGLMRRIERNVTVNSI